MTYTDSKGVLFTLYDSTHAIVGTNKTTSLNAISSSSNLVEYDIPSTVNGRTVVAVGSAAFRSYGKFIRITIPSTVTAIYQYAFDSCMDVANVKEVISLPPKVTVYGYICFSGCYLNKVSISTYAVKMEDSPFGQVYNLRFIEVSKDSKYFANDKQGALYSKDYSRLITVSKLIKKFSIPMTVKSIDVRCFGATVISRIDIPPQVTNVKYFAFRNNAKLKTVIIRGNATNFAAEMISNSGNSLSVYYFGVTKITTKLVDDQTPAKAFVCSFYSGDSVANAWNH